jgi:hypothetical protein
MLAMLNLWALLEESWLVGWLIALLVSFLISKAHG